MSISRNKITTHLPHEDRIKCGKPVDRNVRVFFAPVANKVLEGLISMAWIPQSESEGNELLLPCSNGIWSICVVFTSKTISFKVNWMSPFSRNANHDLYPPCYTWCQTSLVVVKAIWSKRPCSCWATWPDTPSTLCLTAGAASDTPWC